MIIGKLKESSLGQLMVAEGGEEEGAEAEAVPGAEAGAHLDVPLLTTEVHNPSCTQRTAHHDPPSVRKLQYIPPTPTPTPEPSQSLRKRNYRQTTNYIQTIIIR